MLPFAPSQSKDRSRPPPLHIPTRNVPFQSRVNLDITPDHPDFILMERYFDRQLRKHHITVDVILKEHFNPTEIEYLVRSDDSLIVEKQKKHAEEFRQTLATTFKGKLPTLQCKMAMLYFGLRVAPMKKALSQGWKSTTSATYDDGRVMERNPIAFLDIYGPTNPVFGPCKHMSRLLQSLMTSTDTYQPTDQIPERCQVSEVGLWTKMICKWCFGTLRKIRR